MNKSEFSPFHLMFLWMDPSFLKTTGKYTRLFRIESTFREE